MEPGEDSVTGPRGTQYTSEYLVDQQQSVRQKA